MRARSITVTGRWHLGGLYLAAVVVRRQGSSQLTENISAFFPRPARCKTQDHSAVLWCLKKQFSPEKFGAHQQLFFFHPGG